MASASHSAGPNAVGYQHQTWWALVELLQSGADQPDASITLELHDDVAWEQGGSPTQLLQVKHHQGSQRALTDSATDLWRTLNVWMDTAQPSDPSGPELLLVTTQTAGTGTAVAALRPYTRDESAALSFFEDIASGATSAQTAKAREKFLTLPLCPAHLHLEDPGHRWIASHPGCSSARARSSAVGFADWA